MFVRLKSQNVKSKQPEPKRKIIMKKLSEEQPDKEPHAMRYKTPKMKFVLQGIDLGKYTHKPLPYPKTGGRDWRGRISCKRIGGGSTQKYRMVDYTRNPIDENTPLEEKIIAIRYDPLRTADIALVARGNHKRWIIAEDEMKVGQIIKSHGEIPEYPVIPDNGDAHPVGALSLGTIVHNIEVKRGEGGSYARAAGSRGKILSKMEDVVVVTLPSKKQICIDQHCMATIGIPSNAEKNKRPVGSANRSRWFGIRPSSGFNQRKSGHLGKKVKSSMPVVVYTNKTKVKVTDMFSSSETGKK